MDDIQNKFSLISIGDFTKITALPVGRPYFDRSCRKDRCWHTLQISGWFIDQFIFSFPHRIEFEPILRFRFALKFSIDAAGVY